MSRLSCRFVSPLLWLSVCLTAGCDEQKAKSSQIETSETGSQQSYAEYYGGQVRVRKADGGQWQWHPLAVGNGGHNSALAFDPGNSDRIYQVSDVAGVIKTDDGGQHWMNSMTGLQGLANGNYGVGAVSVDPTNPKIVYASVGRTAENPSGIVRSANAGESWEWLSGDIAIAGEGPTAKKFGGPGILVDPRDSQRLYAIDTKRQSGAGGIWISLDGGKTWQVSGKGPLRASGLRFAPGNPDVLWASALNHPEIPGGLFRSDDKGRTWQSAGLSGKDVYNFQFDSGAPETVYAVCGTEGVFRTVDGGKNWAAINDGLPLDSRDPKPRFFTYRYRALDADPFKPGHLIVASDVIRSHFESFDGGKTWRRLPIGDRQVPGGWMLNPDHMGWHTSQVYFHPAKPGVLFSCDFFGTWRSDDGGARWSIHPYGAEQSCMTTVLPDWEKPNRLYLGIWDHDLLIYQDDPEKPRTTRVNGARQESNRTNHHASGIVQDREHPDTLLAVMNSAALIRSEDRGANWTKISEGLPTEPFWRIGAPVLAESANRYFLPVNGETADGGGIYVSEDAGRSWRRAGNKGLPSIDVTGRWDPRHNAFAGRRDGSLLALVSKGKLFLSKDQAESWEAADLPEGIRSVSVVDNILLAGSQGVLFRSEDAGRSWTRLWEGPGTVMLIAGCEDRILIHTWQAGERIQYGLLLTEDAGKTWTSVLNDTLPVWRLRSISFDPFNKGRILASTQWAGTWSAERPK